MYPANIPSLLIEQGKIHLNQDNYIEALACFHEALKIEPQCHRARVQIAETLEKVLDFENSISELQKIVDVGDESAEHYFALGHLAGGFSQEQSAEECYSKAIQIDPHFAEAYLYRGVQRCGRDCFDGAILDFATAIQLDEDYLDAYVERSETLGRIGEYQAAIDDLITYSDIKGRTEDWVVEQIAEYEKHKSEPST